MRKLKLLITILTLSCTAFSQDLTPTVQQLHGDTLFCFSIPQSKEIAKRLQANTYCDSVVSEQEKLVGLFEELKQTEDSINCQLETKILNLEQINQNQGNNIQLLEKTITVKDQKLKKSKAHKILLGIGLGLMTILAVAT